MYDDAIYYSWDVWVEFTQVFVYLGLIDPYDQAPINEQENYVYKLTVERE